jgi:hypothetical protein
MSRRIVMPVQRKERELAHLVSIGPAMLRDFRMLGVHSVAQLADEEPQELYERLCRITGKPEDPCVLDVFSAAVAQARDAELPPAQRQWWYWSENRKRRAAERQSQDRKTQDAKEK